MVARSKRRAKAVPATPDMGNALAFGMRLPMPEFVRPETASLAHAIPTGEDWLHEMSLGGHRLQLRLDGTSAAPPRSAGGRRKDWAVKALDRRGVELTAKFGPLLGAIKALKSRVAIVDGEAVVMKPSGHTDPDALKQALKEGRRALVSYYAFDLLYLDGRDLRAIVLEQRKALLEELLRPVRDERVRYVEHVIGDAEPLYRKACTLGLDGIVAKRRGSPYRSGRTDEWRRIKCGAS